MNLDSLTSVFNSVPTDWLILGGFAVLAAVDTLRAGAKRTATLALALPATYYLVASVPSAFFLGSLTAQVATPFFAPLFFAVILVVMFVLIGRIGLSWGGESGQALPAALSGVAITAILVVFFLQTSGLNDLYHFGPTVQQIFGSAYRFWWLLGSYATLAFVRNS